MQKDVLERLKSPEDAAPARNPRNDGSGCSPGGNVAVAQQSHPQEDAKLRARVVRKVVEDLSARLRNPDDRSNRGALSMVTRISRPCAGEIDWDRTIRKNLHNYLPRSRHS